MSKRVGAKLSLALTLGPPERRFQTTRCSRPRSAGARSGPAFFCQANRRSIRANEPKGHRWVRGGGCQNEIGTRRDRPDLAAKKIGRASWWERECTAGEITVVGVL